MVHTRQLLTKKQEKKGRFAYVICVERKASISHLAQLQTKEKKVTQTCVNVKIYEFI